MLNGFSLLYMGQTGQALHKQCLYRFCTHLCSLDSIQGPWAVLVEKNKRNIILHTIVLDDFVGAVRCNFQKTISEHSHVQGFRWAGAALEGNSKRQH